MLYFPLRGYYMRRLSEVLHISNQKHLIVRISSNQFKALKIGQAIVTKSLTPIGRIFDIFGPIDNPYVSIQPNADYTDPEHLVGETLYSFEEKKSQKRNRI